MAAQIQHQVSPVEVILHHAKDVAECMGMLMVGLLHTILFHRAIGVSVQLVQEVSCQYFKTTFMKSTDSAMEEILEHSLENIGKKLNESRLKSMKIVLSLYNSSWGFKDVFEKWTLNIKQVTAAEGQDENYIGKVSETLRARMKEVAVESLKCDYTKLVDDKSLASSFKVI
eukprot:TRINITY_DN3200_c0_g2_i1.p2 TRINITY_DN3200_c0_g2~~TRINITY_DN3200_c0_g2_i1.p2  ORF type:complete len:171 (-),score=42.73 TRINITY_DN3200_c0_g2_i1:42-554(-)